MATREICKCCGTINAVGFAVPDGVWNQAVPIKWSSGVLCLNCFTRFADEARIQWDESIQFFPVSRVTHENGQPVA